MAKKQAKKAKKVTKKVAKKQAPRAAAAQKKAVNTSGITPLGDRVVVRPLTEEEMGTKSPAGIIIPDTVSKEKPEQGIVIAVGSGRVENGVRVPLEVSVGDRVVFSKFGYDEVTVGGTEYYVVSEGSVLAIINQ